MNHNIIIKLIKEDELQYVIKLSKNNELYMPIKFIPMNDKNPVREKSLTGHFIFFNIVK
mgnify:CR=1 FL=1